MSSDDNAIAATSQQDVAPPQFSPPPQDARSTLEQTQSGIIIHVPPAPSGATWPIGVFSLIFLIVSVSFMSAFGFRLAGAFQLAVVASYLPVSIVFAAWGLVFISTRYDIAVERGWLRVTRRGWFGCSNRHWTAHEVGKVDLGPSRMRHVKDHPPPPGLALLFRGGTHYVFLGWQSDSELRWMAEQLNLALNAQRQQFPKEALPTIHAEEPDGVSTVQTSYELTMDVERRRFFGKQLSWMLIGLDLAAIGIAAWAWPTISGKPVALDHWAAAVGFSLMGLLGLALFGDALLCSLRRYEVRASQHSLEVTILGLFRTSLERWTKDEIDSIDVGPERLSAWEFLYHPQLEVRRRQGKPRRFMPLQDEERLFWVVARVLDFWRMAPAGPASTQLVTPQEEQARQYEEGKKFMTSPVGIALCIAAVAVGIYLGLRGHQWSDAGSVHLTLAHTSFLASKQNIPGLRMDVPPGWLVRYDAKYSSRTVEIKHPNDFPQMTIHLGMDQTPEAELPFDLITTRSGEARVYRSERVDDYDSQHKVDYVCSVEGLSMRIVIRKRQDAELKPTILEMLKTLEYVGPKENRGS